MKRFIPLVPLTWFFLGAVFITPLASQAERQPDFFRRVIEAMPWGFSYIRPGPILVVPGEYAPNDSTTRSVVTEFLGSRGRVPSPNEKIRRCPAGAPESDKCPYLDGATKFYILRTSHRGDTLVVRARTEQIHGNGVSRPWLAEGAEWDLYFLPKGGLLGKAVKVGSLIS